MSGYRAAASTRPRAFVERKEAQRIRAEQKAAAVEFAARAKEGNDDSAGRAAERRAGARAAASETERSQVAGGGAALPRVDRTLADYRKRLAGWEKMVRFDPQNRTFQAHRADLRETIRVLEAHARQEAEPAAAAPGAAASDADGAAGDGLDGGAAWRAWRPGRPARMLGEILSADEIDEIEAKRR